MYQQTVALKVTEDELLFAAVDIVFTGNYKGHFTPGKAYPYYLDAAMGGQRGIIIEKIILVSGMLLAGVS